jgi:hypothetical protein
MIELSTTTAPPHELTASEVLPGVAGAAGFLGCRSHYTDMVGVTGSIPVAPTIRTTENRLLLIRFALAALARRA